MDQQPPYYTPQGHQSEPSQHASGQQPPNGQPPQLGSNQASSPSSTSQQPYQGHSQFPQYQSGSYQAPLHHYQYNEYSQQQQQQQPPASPQSLSQTPSGYQSVQPLFQPQLTSQTLPATQASQTRSNIPGQSTPISIPLNQIAPGGAPARQYINEAVAPYLLEGMKMLVREQPPDPLRVLGEWLIEKHRNLNENEAT